MIVKILQTRLCGYWHVGESLLVSVTGTSDIITFNMARCRALDSDDAIHGYPIHDSVIPSFAGCFIHEHIDQWDDVQLRPVLIWRHSQL
jgi:hypothetical protein